MKNYDFLVFLFAILIGVVLYLVIGGLGLLIFGDDSDALMIVSIILLIGIPLVSLITANRVVKKIYNKK